MQNEMMNKVIEVLKRYGSTKTGDTHKAFNGYEDLKIDEIEMLEYLFTYCSETLEALEKVCEHYKEEFNKSNSVSVLIMRTTFELDKIYNFGWLNSSKVDVPDTIKDIKEIPMKNRYIRYLSKLREIMPGIEEMFVSAYNQIQPHLNFLRIEQVFQYLQEELEYQGIKIPYAELDQACPHLVKRPYFSRANYGYYIVDNHGCFDGHIYLSPNNWTYIALKSPSRWHGNKSLGEISIQKLRELRDLAGFSKDLDWELVYANYHDMQKNDPFKGAEKFIEISIEIPKRMKGKHRLALKDICNKFKPIITGINQD